MFFNDIFSSFIIKYVSIHLFFSLINSEYKFSNVKILKIYNTYIFIVYIYIHYFKFFKKQYLQMNDS